MYYSLLMELDFELDQDQIEIFENDAKYKNKIRNKNKQFY